MTSAGSTTGAFVPVLCYHRISDTSSDLLAPYTVTPTTFRQQLDLVIDAGYRCVTFGQLVELYRAAHAAGTDRLPGQPVAVVTVDDGFADFATDALPALQERGVPASLFVTTGLLQGTPRPAPGPEDPMLAWSQLRELRDAGVEIAAHSHTHPHMDTMKTAGVREELRLPKELLEDLLGQPILQFAYPHGYNGPRVRRLTREAGYDSAAGVRHMLSRPDDDLFTVSRLLVENTTTDEEFSAWLAGEGARKPRRGDSMATRGWRAYRRGKAIVQGRPVSVFPPAAPGDAPAPVAGEDGFMPRRVLAVDLATRQIEYPDPADRRDHPRARVLVNWRDEPIGVVEVTADDTDVVRAATEQAWEELRARLIEVVQRSGSPEPASPADLAVGVARPASTGPAPTGPLVTVTIASLRNVSSTVRTVRRVLQGCWRPLEVVVVDNDTDPGPLTAALEEAFSDDDRVRWVHEPRRGLSFARNAGLAAARGEITVFTDDDVLVDRHWVERLVAAFEAAPGVACVTGAIVPAELETQPQLWLEEYGGFHKGFERQIFNLTTHRRDMPLYPYNAGLFGSGANMAFRTEALRAMGGFAVDLGAGTAAHGGEDLDVLQRAVSAGHTLVYEPAALMWHHHRRSFEALRRQMFRYGIGLSATVTKWMLDDRRTALAIARRVPGGIVYLLSPGSKKNAGKSTEFPRLLTLLELCGIVVGPVAYLRSRRQARGKDAGRPVAIG